MESSSLSSWSLILHANFIVQLIMLVLIIMSVYSWAIMVRNYKQINQYSAERNRFDTSFWSGANITKIYNHYLAHKDTLFGKSLIYMTAYIELLGLKQIKNLKGETIIEGVERTVNIAISQESKELEKGLSTLGTIGAIAPYIGLVGTVWGIMSSFNTLGDVEQATISIVAPHIAEALIATALGLFVAIPAVIGHSRFTNHIDDLTLNYESFNDDVCLLLLREAYKDDIDTKSSQS